MLDNSVPGHFGTDFDISVLGTGQFGTYAVCNPFRWPDDFFFIKLSISPTLSQNVQMGQDYGV